jgi:O-antigen/teichoic acid export membrane protein
MIAESASMASRMRSALKPHVGLALRLSRLLLGPSLLKLSEAVLGIAISVALVRTMAIEDYGRFSFLFALARITTLPARQGLSNLMVKEISRELPKERFGRIHGLLRWSAGFALAWMVPSVLGVWAVYQLSSLPSGESVWLGIAFACAAFCAAGPFTGYTRAYRQPSLSIVPESFLGPLLFLALLAVPYFGHFKLSVDEALLWRGLTVLGVLVGGRIFLRRLAERKRVESAQAEYAGKTWARMVVPFTLVASALLINQQAGLVLAGFLFDARTVALYRVADQFAFVLTFMPTVGGYVAAPYIAEAAQHGRKAEVRRLIGRSMAGTLLVSLVFFLALVAFGRFILERLYGPQLAEGYWLMLLLAGARSLNAGTVFNLTFLNMSGSQRPLVTIIVVTVITQVVLGLALSLPFGIYGVALGAAISIVLNAALIVRRSQLTLREAD